MEGAVLCWRGGSGWEVCEVEVERYKEETDGWMEGGLAGGLRIG